MSREMVAVSAEEYANLKKLYERATELENVTVLALLNIRGLLDLAMDHVEFGSLKFPASINAAVRVCHKEAHQALKEIGVVETEDDLNQAEEP